MTKWVSPSRLGVFAAIGLVFSALLGPTLRDAASFVYPQIAICVLVMIGLWKRVPDFSLALDPRTWRLLLAASLFWLVAVAVSTFLGFRVNGIDFSIFDWMLESTHRGRFGYSPIYDVNHFGVHSSFILLAWVPFHELIHSPFWLVVSTAVVVWLGIFPLRRLSRLACGGPHGALELMLVLCWIGNPWMGAALKTGFRPELLLPVLTLWFLVGWIERNGETVGLSVFALLMTKEDSALFIVGFAIAGTLVERWRWRQALWLAVVCVGWLALYVFFLQPLLAKGHATYWSFWSDFGATPKEVMVGMVTHPWLLVTKVVTSRWWMFFLPLALLPFRSIRAVGGMLPTLILLGAASYWVMFRYEAYYPLPLIGFALFGVLDVHAVWRSGSRPRLREAVVLIGIGLFGVVGATYPRVVPFELDAHRHLARAYEVAREKGTVVCAQPVLFPHLGYARTLLPLMDLSCLDRPGAVALVNLALDSSPVQPAEFAVTVSSWRDATPSQELEGGFVVIGPRATQN